MKTLKQLEAACKKAEHRAYEWFAEYETALDNFFVKDGGAQLFPLKEFYRDAYYQNRSIVDEIVNDAVDVYEEDLDAGDVYKVCTRRAVKCLRRLEQKHNEWNAKRYYLECAAELVHRDGTPYKYCENDLAEITRKLAALGVSI